MSICDGILHDWLGNEVKVGSTIVYPGRSGSNLWMNMAEVIDISHVPDSSHREMWKLRVQPKKVSWLWGQKLDKPVTLTAVDRITVVPTPVKAGC